MALTKEQIESISEAAAAVYEKDPMAFKRLVKEKFPEVNIPELDIEQKISERTKTQDDKITELETKNVELEKKLSVIMQRGNLEKEGRTKEEIEAIENKIKNKEVNTYEGAVKLMEAEKQLAKPTTPAISRQIEKPFDEERLAEISKPGWAREEAAKVIDEINARRGGNIKI